MAMNTDSYVIRNSVGTSFVFKGRVIKMFNDEIPEFLEFIAKEAKELEPKSVKKTKQTIQTHRSAKSKAKRSLDKNAVAS